MVKKLMKYDIIAFGRTMLPMFAIVLGIAVINRFIRLFESNNVGYRIAFISSVTALVIASIVCLVMTAAVAVTRFYKNLFTKEGYLSFTLPVTVNQHIVSKWLTTLIFAFIAVLTVLASVLIATSGGVATEIFKALAFIGDKYFDYFKFNGVLYIIEAVLLIALVFSYGAILCYGCISVGQLAKKNRVLASFGAFFGYYIITQILGTVFLIIFTINYDKLPIEQIEKFMAENVSAAVHIVFGFLIIWNLLLTAIFYTVTHYNMKKKLNLE